MLGEVARIAAAIPHEDLALQWDVCVEMVQWDGRWQNAPQFPGMEQVFAAMFRRLSKAVPEDIELGFHLCYGDLDAAHFIEPTDATKMVELANLITASAGRPVAYVHMPVPVNRTDDAYYEPLCGLRLPPGTELYLGLVHVSDGVVGTRHRMAMAGKYVRDFGIASECGISRGRHPDLAAEFMRVYAGAAEAGPAEAPDA
jgi:methionine synthase II (cobalamin-independent)